MLIFGGNNCFAPSCHISSMSRGWELFYGTKHFCAKFTSFVHHLIRLQYRAPISCFPGKTEGMYTEMLREMVNACRGLGLNSTPQTIVTDFEKTAINAARNVLGVNDITGCYFHFCGSVWKRIQKLGLTNFVQQRTGKAFCWDVHCPSIFYRWLIKS